MPSTGDDPSCSTQSSSTSSLKMADNTTDSPKDTATTEPIETVEGNADELSAEDQAAIAAAMAEDNIPQAKSLKCLDCGKLFKNADLANYHAEKSGHENFEESTEEVPPL